MDTGGTGFGGAAGCGTTVGRVLTCGTAVGKETCGDDAGAAGAAGTGRDDVSTDMVYPFPIAVPAPPNNEPSAAPSPDTLALYAPLAALPTPATALL